MRRHAGSRQKPAGDRRADRFLYQYAGAAEPGISGDMSFSTLLEEVKETTLEAYSHQEVPFEKVVDAVVKERDMSRSPLFQVMFSLQNTPEVPELKLGDSTI